MVRPVKNKYILAIFLAICLVILSAAPEGLRIVARTDITIARQRAR